MNALYALLVLVSALVSKDESVAARLWNLGLDRLATPACTVLLLKDCQPIRDATVAPAATPASGGAVTGPDATISTVRAPGALPPPPAGVDRSAHRVFVQFAGSYQRAAIVAAATRLNTAGWRMQGWQSGGERTPAAAGKLEVRYGDESEAAAAAALAADVAALAITGPLVPRKVPGIASGTLEIWMSN